MIEDVNMIIEKAFKNDCVKLGSRVLEGLKYKDALLILTSDISSKQSELYKSIAKKYGTKYIVIGTATDLANAIGRINHNAAVIVNKKWVSQIIDCYNYNYNKNNDNIMQ